MKKKKSYWLWWIVFLMRKYINADVLEIKLNRIVLLDIKSDDLFNSNIIEGIKEKRNIQFIGIIKDRCFEKWDIKINGVQILDIPLWKKVLMTVWSFRTPILVDQIFIDGKPAIESWKKIVYPKEFRRK